MFFLLFILLILQLSGSPHLLLTVCVFFLLCVCVGICLMRSSSMWYYTALVWYIGLNFCAYLKSRIVCDYADFLLK